MKLRIHNNSIRLRLTQTEVARLAAGQSVEQTTEFTPTTSLTSLVKPAAHLRAATVTFQNNQITVLLPIDEVRVWAQSNQPGIEASQTITPGKSLSILIEKDFQCLHSAAEENADAFPNPRSA
jgi:hypothetical protein